MNLPTVDTESAPAKALSARLRERAGSYAQYRLFKGRTGPATVRFVCVRIDADMVGIVWRVTPVKDPSRGQKTALGAALRAWQKSPDAWTVEGDAASGRPFLLAERLSLYALRRLVVELCGEKDAEGLPVTVAPPTDPKAPLSPRAVAFTLRNLMPSVGGERFPFDGLADLVRSLPGDWSLSAGDVAVGLTSAADEYRMARALETVLRPHVTNLSVSVYAAPRSWGSGEPVDCSFRLAKDDADRLVERDALFRKLVPEAPAAWETGTIVTLGPKAPRVYAEPRGWTVKEHNGAQEYHARRLFVVRPAVVVTAPSGERFGIAARSWQTRSRVNMLDALNPHAFYAWARRVGMTLLAERVLASYGAEGIDAYLQVLQHKTGDVARLAECQLCARIHMTRAPKGGDALMVDHGYTYPRTDGVRGGMLGERVGSCFAVGYRPYERAHDALDMVIPGARADVVSQERGIEHLAKEIDGSVSREWLTVPAAALAAKRGEEPNREKDAPEWSSVGPDDPTWMHFAAIGMAARKTALRRAVDCLRWLEKRRAAWTLRPTVGEVMTALDEARAAVPAVPADD